MESLGTSLLAAGEDCESATLLTVLAPWEEEAVFPLLLDIMMASQSSVATMKTEVFEEEIDGV